MKNKGVYFTRSGAVVTKDDKLINNIKNIVLNPDLTYVNSTNPKYWKLYEGHIVPMTDSEKKHRDHIIEKYGIEHTPILKEAISKDIVTEDSEDKKLDLLAELSIRLDSVDELSSSSDRKNKIMLGMIIINIILTILLNIR